MAGRGDVFVQVDQVTVRVREGEGNRYVLFLVKLAELSFLSCCSCQKGVALRPRPAAYITILGRERERERAS